MTTITTSLQDHYVDFLRTTASTYQMKQNQIIQKGLDLYQAHLLDQQIKAGFADRFDEYQSTNQDFMDLQLSSI